MSAAELAAWQATPAAAGVSLSELLRQAMARTQTWTAPAREIERARTRQIARIGSNLNQIAHWAHTHLDDVTVLRGDPDQVAAVSDSLEFDHKYTSGVIAWAPEDQPSAQDIDRVLDEFEQSAWAGLAPDRYAWAAVQHRAATGGVHVHVLAARCDLETGKSLNIAPPGWEHTYGPLVEACNLDHGWSRPDDLRAAIRDYLRQRVEHGTVQDRAGVVAALHEAGLDVPRQGDHYVTVRDPATGTLTLTNDQESRPDAE